MSTDTSSSLPDLTPEQLAHRIADRAVISDIETQGHRQIDGHGRLWYDTRPMLDPREHPEEWVDMAREALDYALARGLISPHPHDTNRVRIVVGVQP